MTVSQEARAWLEKMKDHTDCCGTPMVRKLVAELAGSGWRPLLNHVDYPHGPLLVAAADRETGEVGFFICRAADHGKFYPMKWGPQDKRPGMEWLWLQEDGWTPFAWSEFLPDFPEWPLPHTTGDDEPE